MNKYQEALNYLAKAQKIIDDLAKEESKEKNKTYKQIPPDRQEIERLVLSVLSCSVVPLSVRDMGKTCRKIRRASSSDKEEVLGRMVDRGVTGFIKTSQTTKFYLIEEQLA